jgi:exonuclease SbcC
MRLHRLTLRAFGPFPGTEQVDFDDLATGGLFLLHGPTGAGKTSVLDAVCFALYGVVPGARARITRLRSDHAAEGVAPEVICEFSVGPRRFEVTRSPSWERPKRRGDGTTTEQARVLVSELLDGEWQPLTTRLDEAAHLLDQVLGLGHDQFTKLVLLPQGDFAAFLRADAETRREMLERLFETDRFSAVQTWLRDRRQDLWRQVAEARTVTRELLARAEQAAVGLPPDPAAGEARRSDDRAPDTPEPADTGGPGTDDVSDLDGPGPREHVAALLARAVLAWEDASSRRAATQVHLARARTAHQAGLLLARRQAEHRAMAAAADRLAGAEPGVTRLRERLREADRAVALVPIAPELAQSVDARERLQTALTTASSAAIRQAETIAADGTPLADALAAAGVLLLDPATLGAVDQGVLAATASGLRAQVGHAQEVAREAGRLAEVTASCRGAERDALRARESLATVVTAADDLDRQRHVVTERLSAARTVAAGAPAAVAALQAAEAIADAARERDQVQADLEAAQPALLTARQVRADARETWLDLRERRLDGMAAELADGLVAGRPCAVCGSAEHPAPARPGADRVTDAQEQRARQRVERADAELATLEATAAQLARSAAAAVRAAAGQDVAAAEAAVLAARAGVEAGRRAERESATLTGELDRLTAAAVVTATDVEVARSRAHECDTALAAQAAAQAQLSAQVDTARGADPSLAARIARLSAGAAALDAVLAARAGAAEAGRALATARRTAAAAAREAGFGDLDAALAAVLDETERARLETRLRDHDGELATVTSRLEDADLLAAAALPPPDVAQLASDEVLAQGDDEACAQQVALAERAAQALRQIEAALAVHAAVAGPLAARHRTVSELSRCAEGTGGDNRRRMSLSAYVLAARLEQVAEAASLRLAQMSGGRYTLVHSDEVSRGQRRSGLGLHVIDGWTGQRRETASLSGGESFYTSLALALGLADVVSAEAGGTAIETLFVDEGFGSLDSETLDEVMDVLDGLRSGGRAVGLVSHVADLRDRVPARLEVIKGREGSHLQVAAS